MVYLGTHLPSVLMRHCPCSSSPSNTTADLSALDIYEPPEALDPLAEACTSRTRALATASSASSIASFETANASC